MTPADARDDDDFVDEDATHESPPLGVVRKRCASGGGRVFVTVGEDGDVTPIAVLGPDERD